MTIYENWIKAGLENYIKHYTGKEVNVSDDDAQHFAASVKAYVGLFCYPSLPSNLDEAADEIVKDWLAYGNGEYKKLAIAGAEWHAGQGVKIGQTKIYLEDDGGEPPYDGKTWLDLESTEYAIPTDKFKDGDEVDIILRKK